MISKKFTYGDGFKLSRVILFLISIFCFALGLVYLAGLISLLTSQETELSSSASDLFWTFIGLSVWSPLIYAFLSYKATDIEVEEGGLRIKFIFKSLFIDWIDIDEFKSATTLGFWTSTQARILVTKNALTPFHRLYGLMHGNTNKPSLLISTNISNYEELFKIIKNNRKKERLHQGEYL